MSWFTDIAGKAEDFLNKIDQNAAEAINKAADLAETRSTKTSRRSSPRNSHTTSTAVLVEDNPAAEYFNGANNATSLTPDEGSSSRAINNGGVITVQEKSSGSPLLTKSKSKSSKNRDVRSANSSPRPGSGGEGSTIGKSLQNSENELRSSSSTSTIPKISATSSSSSKKKNDEELLEFLNDPNRKELDENLVLQTELANQAREVERLYKTNKQLQSDNDTLKSKLSQQEDGKTKEARVEEFESQLKQSDTVQKNLKKLLINKDEEIVKLKKSLDQSLEKLQQLEVLQSTQNRLEMVEMEKQKLLQSNEELKGEISSVNERVGILDGQLASMKGSLTLVESEYTSYKEKAKSILKQKDDLITSLQDPSFGNNQNRGNSQQGEETSPYLSEINALKSERELLNAEISQCRSTTDSIREETARLEQELNSTRSLMSQIQRQLVEEKSISSSLQDENLQLRQQYSSSQYELDLEKSERRKLEEWKTQRESEDSSSYNNSQGGGQNLNNYGGRLSPIDNSRKYYNNNFGGDSEETLRMRITALTQSLLEKQGLINNLSSDKQLLQINVERLQEQISQQQQPGGNHDYASSSNNSGFSQTVISSKPLYLSESPWDNKMSSGVKRAFSTVDSLCCQAGILLRRRPNLRLGFCIYTVLLHFWVFFILFHSFKHVPHTDDHRSNGPAPSPM